VTFEVQRQTRPSRWWQALTGQWESCLEHLDERPGRSAARGGPDSEGCSPWIINNMGGRRSPA
jgi:hypothetical protein